MRIFRFLLVSSLALVMGVLSLNSAANAATLAFSFSSSSTNPFNGTHVDGTVTGLIYDVELTGNNQHPEYAVITSDPFGFAGTKITLTAGSIDLTDGVVTGASLRFGDFPAELSINLRFSGDVYGNGLRNLRDFSVVGNGDGLSGITFSIVPLPATLLLFGTALAALGGLVWWHRRRPAPAVSSA